MNVLNSLFGARCTLAIVGTLMAVSTITGCPDASSTSDAPDTVDSADACPTCVQGSLQIVDARARSCELVLQAASGGGDVVVTFADGVTGRALTEGDRTGVAFVAAAGAELPQAPASMTAPGELTLLSSRCFDDGGAPIEGTAISL